MGQLKPYKSAESRPHCFVIFIKIGYFII